MSTPADLAASGEDYDIERAWNEAVKSFLKTTKGEYDPTKPPKVSPQQVLDQIAARQAKDDEKSAKFATAKDVIGKSLRAVQLLGGIAAQAASTVYPGTSLCYNALTYLISAGQNYNKIFASLTDLFSRISDVLDRFVVYHEMDAQSKSNIDIPLKKIITQLLLSFIRICELSIKVLNENRLKKMLKVIAFNDDEGISAEVAALERLTSNESQMRGTLTYKSVRNIETVTAAQTESMKVISKGIESVEKAAHQQETDSASKKQKDRLEKVFGKENKSEAIFRQYRDTRVPNTGSWLLVDPLFRKWADPDTLAAPFLFVSGKEGFGKSYLCANTVVNLQERFPPSNVDANRRILIGHAFLQRASKETKPIAEALKSLVLQFSNDEVFVKEFSGIAGEQELDSGNDDQVADLFAKLVDTLAKVSSTTFIVIDGVDDVDDGRALGKNAFLLWRMLQDMQNTCNTSAADPTEAQTTGIQVNGTSPEETSKKSKKPPKVRVFITGSTRAQEQFVTDRIFETIDLTGSNSQDIESWVSDRIASMPNLQAAANSGDDVKTRVLEALLGVTSGDFKYIDLLLKEIASKERTSEIDRVLDRVKTGETRKEMIGLEVRNLNENLSSADIKDFNEMLLWILANLDYLVVSELEAALYLQNGETNFSSLIDRIKAKFSSFLTVEPNEVEHLSTVSLQSDTHREYFAEASQIRADQHKYNSTVVNDSEVKIVQRFLRSVCDDELFKKFGFEEFFQQKLQRDEDVIFVDLESAHLQMMERCLKIIGSPDENLNALRYYVIDYFHAHMERVDLSLSAPEKKYMIGPLLIQLLTENDTILRWWGQGHNKLRFDLLYDVDDDFINCVISWLKDSAVLKDLTEEQRTWAKTVTSNVKSPVMVLENVAKFWTDQWLRGDWQDNDMSYFICVHTYISKLNYLEHQEAITDDPPSDLAIDHIQESWNWALEQLQIDGNEYSNRYNLGRTLRFFGHITEAIEQLKVSITLTEDNWMAHWDVAIAYEMQENYQAALDYFTENWEKLSAGAEANGYLFAVLLCRARWNVSAGNTDLGVSQYLEMLRETPNPWYIGTVALRVIHVHKDQSAVTSIIELLQDLDSRQHDSFECPYTVFAYALNYDSDIFHEAILDASKRTDSPTLLEAQYSKALEIVQSSAFKKEYKNQYDIGAIAAVLQHYHATLCYDAGNEDRAIELWQELSLSATATNTVHYLAQAKARKRLCSMYLTRLRALTGDDEESQQKRAHYEALFAIILETGTELFDPRLILGRYYLKCGDLEKARELVKPRLKTALDLLSDDDPSNDWQGFQILATIFNHMDEDENSLAAWSLMTPPYLNPRQQQEESEEEEGEEEENEDGEEQEEMNNEDTEQAVNGVSEETEENTETAKPEKGESEGESGSADNMKNADAAQDSAPNENGETNEAEGQEEAEAGEEGTENADESPDQRYTLDAQGPLSYGCDGDACECTWAWASDMRHCRDCLDVLFCEKHHKALKEDGARYVTCDPSHDFLVVPAYDAELIAPYAPDNVKVGERVLPLRDWLNEIRKDWGFPMESDDSSEEEAEEQQGDEEQQQTNGEAAGEETPNE